MSVLTKLFVTLNVVVSLLLASGIVVFVNMTHNYSQSVKAAEADAARQTARAQTAEQLAIATRGEADTRIAEANTRALSYRTALEAKIDEVGKVQAELASAQTAMAKAQNEASAANLAAQGALRTVEAQQKVINDTAAKLTAKEKEYTESSTRVAQLTQENDGLKATQRRLREEITAKDERIDELSRNVARGGAGANEGAGQVASANNLRGVIKAKRSINGIEYATISLGSADNVTKGMKFKVVNQNNFLGYLTIDAVEPQESVGHLEGPNLAMVAPGSEVRTQW